ncbi:hypothetical protein, partial [uncultured Sphingomonas sp.]
QVISCAELRFHLPRNRSSRVDRRRRQSRGPAFHSSHSITRPATIGFADSRGIPAPLIER